MSANRRPQQFLTRKGFSAQWQTQRCRESELSGVGDAQRADAIASGTIATSCKARARWNGRVAAFVASPQKNELLDIEKMLSQAATFSV